MGGEESESKCQIQPGWDADAGRDSRSEAKFSGANGSAGHKKDW